MAEKLRKDGWQPLTEEVALLDEESAQGTATAPADNQASPTSSSPDEGFTKVHKRSLNRFTSFSGAAGITKSGRELITSNIPKPKQKGKLDQVDAAVLQAQGATGAANFVDDVDVGQKVLVYRLVALSDEGVWGNGLLLEVRLPCVSMLLI
jgi:hypothetical protein